MSKIDISQYPETVEAFGGNVQRATVFLDRYALKDENGVPIEKRPHDMWVRVANALGETGNQSNDFYRILEDFKFVPGGRILAGAGTDTEVTFYNCYVIPVETENGREIRRAMKETGEDRSQFVEDDGADSRRAIFDTIGRMVDIMSRGGGVGINWSVLRPKGAYLKTVNGTSSGPVGWMDVASKAVGEVEQGGSRRGAAMFMLDDWHPDVLDFINSKRDLGRITNANISVAVSDNFMEAVKLDALWTMGFPDTRDPHYDTEWDGNATAWIEKGYGWVEYQTVKARDIWRALAQAAWDNGEPGVVFLDRYNKESTGLGVERIISVNPCGEQGLGPYSVCNLGSMNLDAYIRKGPTGYSFDWWAYEEDVRIAVQFLDRVIDENYYFIPENEDAQKSLRRIGLGVMGLADALIAQGYRYGSVDAIEFTERIFWVLKASALDASITLAIDKGPAPAWSPEMASRPYLADYEPEDEPGGLKEYGLRNLFLLTQAPTGTTSILAGVNSGIEPYFAFGYWREDRTGKHYVASAAVEKYKDGEDWSGEEWVTANDVTVEEHIAMQAAAQRHIDSSVSKTINAPNSHTVEDVERAYTLAYESGLKGLAYFRDGCGRSQVLTREEPAERLTVVKDAKFSRPPALTGTTWRERASVGHVYVTVNRDTDGKPVEVFINAGKSGSDVLVMGEALGRLISLSLQNGTGLYDITHTLRGVGGNGKMNVSLPNAVATMLVEDQFNYDTKGEVEVDLPQNLTHKAPDNTGQLCPDCQSFSVVMEEGCSKCQICGWSAC